MFDLAYALESVMNNAQQHKLKFLSSNGRIEDPKNVLTTYPEIVNLLNKNWSKIYAEILKKLDPIFKVWYEDSDTNYGCKNVKDCMKFAILDLVTFSFFEKQQLIACELWWNGQSWKESYKFFGNHVLIVELRIDPSKNTVDVKYLTLEG